MKSSEMERRRTKRNSKQSSEGAKRAAARISSKKKRIAEEERERPLRRRILSVLSQKPSTPTDLSSLVDAPKESVSRTLRVLRDEGLIEGKSDQDDGRRRYYSLTISGEIELRDHRAFGAKDPTPKAASSDQVSGFLEAALGSAVEMRREANRLQEAIDQLTIVLEQAEKAKAHTVALNALLELITTLRQDRQWDAVDELLPQLDAIADGSAGVGAELALPATAHLEYSYGRLCDHRKEDSRERAGHLIAAASLYAQLDRKSETPRKSEWIGRRAWSIVSLAGNLRKQSKLREALDYAELARRHFNLLDDHYGQSHCFFMLGYCLRMLGDFDEAWACLDKGYEVAEKHSYERFKADSLMQMGEVRRCQGHSSDARMLLSDAMGRADSMDLRVTQAFAQSALGALEYQEERFPEADAALKSAQGLFERCGHVEGMALNSRRHAVVARAGAKSRSDVKGLITAASERYFELRSPAGMAACEIEEGRLRKERGGGSVETVAKGLRKRLDDLDERDTLEKDFWVPRVFNEFAREIENEDLVELTDELQRDASERLALEAAPTIERVETFADVIREPANGDRRAAEMGGEAPKISDHEMALAA